MKVGAFITAFIAVGLIAYQHDQSLFNLGNDVVSKSLPSTFEVQAHLLTYSQFSTVAFANSSERSIEVQIPAESLFYRNSTSISPEAERQFTQLVNYLNSVDENSRFEVSLLGTVDPGFNPKFRHTRARKLAEVIKKAGVAENRIAKVWQVVVDEPAIREIASQAGPSASFDFTKNQYFSIRILSDN